MYAAIGDSRLMVRAARSTVFIATSISSSFSLSISSYECAGAVPLFVVFKRFSFPVYFSTEGVPQARGPRADYISTEAAAVQLCIIRGNPGGQFMLRINDEAPNFTAETSQGTIN